MLGILFGTVLKLEVTASTTTDELAPLEISGVSVHVCVMMHEAFLSRHFRSGWWGCTLLASFAFHAMHRRPPSVVAFTLPMGSLQPPRSVHPGGCVHATPSTPNNVPQSPDSSLPPWEALLTPWALGCSGIHQPPSAHPVKEVESKNVRVGQAQEQRPGREAGGWAPSP